MKLTDSLVLPALCWSARLVAASSASVYTYDPQSQPRSASQASTIDPVVARLVLAQRVGVEDYHRSELGREDVVSAINEYGVRTSLFGQEKSKAKRALILAESDDISTDASSSVKLHTSFELSPAPDESSIRGLFVDLVRQVDPASFSRLEDTALYTSLQKGEMHSTAGDLFYVTKSRTELEEVFTRLAKTNEWSITAVVMPTRAGDFGHAGFMVHDQYQDGRWGTYEMPNAQSQLKKRAQVKEEPLTETGSFQPVSSLSAPVSSFAANNTKPLRGILPACFSSQSSCESATRNCTGHGSCVRKYHDSTASQGGRGTDCFVCACKATTSNGGKKTTKWGGPACQKKDVSVEFWLIVLFTVGLIGLIGFAIGTIWEMGSQDLPSVIGAGVSGPTARK